MRPIRLPRLSVSPLAQGNGLKLQRRHVGFVGRVGSPLAQGRGLKPSLVKKWGAPSDRECGRTPDTTFFAPFQMTIYSVEGRVARFMIPLWRPAGRTKSIAAVKCRAAPSRTPQ